MGMDDLLIVIFFSLVGGIVSLIGGLFLLSQNTSSQKLARYATPFAAGALLAAVFLDLLPEGLEEAKAETVFISSLAGILLFFIAERFLRWFHHHHGEEDKHTDPAIGLIIIGDTLHNILDGVAIAAAFLINVPTGIVTTIAVAAHEIPQEIGDFGLLLAKGMRRRNVLLVNIFSALATTAAAVITYLLGAGDMLPIGVLLGLSAGFLLYIALSDIMPSIHESTDASKLVQLQTLMLIIGVVVVGISIEAAHSFVDNEHEHNDTQVVEQHSHND